MGFARSRHPSRDKQLPPSPTPPRFAGEGVHQYCPPSPAKLPLPRSGGGLGRGCRDPNSTSDPAHAPPPDHPPSARHQPAVPGAAVERAGGLRVLFPSLPVRGLGRQAGSRRAGRRDVRDLGRGLGRTTVIPGHARKRVNPEIHNHSRCQSPAVMHHCGRLWLWIPALAR